MTPRTRLNRKSVVVSALGITQTLAWGSAYYLTAFFTDPVSADLKLSRTWFYSSMSAALLLRRRREPNDRNQGRQAGKRTGRKPPEAVIGQGFWYNTRARSHHRKSRPLRRRPAD